MKKQNTNKNIGPFLAFTKAYFAKHQSIILFFLNAPILKYLARYIFKINKDDCPINKKIENISPNSFTIDANLKYFKKSALLKTDYENPELPRNIRRIAKKLYIKIQKGVLKDKEVLLPAKTINIRTHPKYSKRLYFALKPLWWAMHYWDEFFADRYAPAYSFGFLTLTQYPDAGTGATTVDAMQEVNYTNGNGVSWATIIARTTADGTYASGDSNALNFIINVKPDGGGANQWANLVRAHFLFDTSALTTSATISAAVLSLYGQNKADPSLAITPDVNIYASTSASNNNIVSGDFDNFGSTAFATAITYAGWSTSAYNDFTLNASGISNISKTGVSKFGTRNANYDVAASSPTWATTGAGDHYLSSYFADHTGTANDPKLVITYTAANNYTQGLTETITLVQSQLKTPSKQLEEVVTLVQTQIKKPTKVFVEVITLVVTATAVKIANKVFTEVVTLVDTAKRTGGKLIIEIITLVQSFSRVSTAFRTLTEVVTLVASASTVKTQFKTITETVVLVQTQLNKPVKALTETITLAVTAVTASAFFKALTETVVLVASITTVKSFNRTFTETVTLVETQIRSTAKRFTEIITLVASALTPKTAVKAITEVVTLVASSATMKTQHKTITETITLVVVSVKQAGKVLQETLSLTLRFLGLKNGLDIRYIQKYVSQAGNYIKKYLNIPDEG